MAIDNRPPRIDVGHSSPPVRSRRPGDATSRAVLPPPAPLDFDRLARDLSAQGRFIDDPERILAELDEGIAQSSRTEAGCDKAETRGE